MCVDIITYLFIVDLNANLIPGTDLKVSSLLQFSLYVELVTFLMCVDIIT